MNSWSLVLGTCIILLLCGVESSSRFPNTSLGVFLLEIVFLAVVYTVKEQVFNFCLLSIIKSLVRPDLFVVLFLLVEAFLEHEDVQVSGGIIGIEEPHYLGGDLLFGEILVRSTKYEDELA